MHSREAKQEALLCFT